MAWGGGSEVRVGPGEVGPRCVYGPGRWGPGRVWPGEVGPRCAYGPGRWVRGARRARGGGAQVRVGPGEAGPRCA